MRVKIPKVTPANNEGRLYMYIYIFFGYNPAVNLFWDSVMLTQYLSGLSLWFKTIHSNGIQVRTIDIVYGTYSDKDGVSFYSHIKAILKSLENAITS